jgi:hypothetical protein
LANEKGALKQRAVKTLKTLVIGSRIQRIQTLFFVMDSSRSPIQASVQNRV